MNKEIADRLKAEYEYLWHDSMRDLPDGWKQPLVNLLDRIYKLSTVGPTNWRNEGCIGHAGAGGSDASV